MRFFAPFAKVEEQPDGTLLVEGIASSESEDADGEVIRADAMRKALPDYMRYGGTGPLREMHQLQAAGRTIAADVRDDGKTYISAKVVDTEAVRKVKEGVYVGFSVGGKVLKRNASDASVIEEMALVEISLVDRPANPDAVIQIWKADMSEKTERPFTRLSSIVAAFAKGKLSLDDAEKQALEIGKAASPVVRKGMYQVSMGAQIMDELSMLEQSCAYEAEAEGDQSAVPSMVSEAMKAFASALKALLDEELSEMVGGDEPEKAAKAVARAGELAAEAAKAAHALAEAMKAAKAPPPAAVLSEEHKAALAEVHGHVKDAADRIGQCQKALKAVGEGDEDAAKAVGEHLDECTKRLGKADEAMNGMGYKGKDDESGDDGDAGEKDKAATVDDVAKAAPAEDLVKIAAERDALAKALAASTAAVEKANALAEQLSAELAKRPKGALRAVPVEKAADNGTLGGGDDPDALMKAAMDPESSEEARSAARRKLVTLSHSRPMRIG